MTEDVVLPVVRGYRSIRAVAEMRNAPKRMPIGRNGRIVKARGYSLTDDKLRDKLEEWWATGVLPVPYTKSRLGDMLQALINLGVNRAWSLELEVCPELKRIMSHPTRKRNDITDWDRWVKRPKRTPKGKTFVDKVYREYREFRRIDDENSYHSVGLKLKQMGCCLDIFLVRTYDDVGVVVGEERYVRLNTRCTAPIQLVVRDIGVIPAVDMRKPTLGPPEGHTPTRICEEKPVRRRRITALLGIDKGVRRGLV